MLHLPFPNLPLPEHTRHRLELFHAISVFHIDHMEIKCFKLFVDRVWRTYVIYLTVDLKAIIVNDHNKVVQISVACKHGSLPDLTFLDLSVSKKSVYSVGIIA